MAAILAAVVLVSAHAIATAQPPRGSPPLPNLPQVYETADQKIRVVKLADGLANPWGHAWLPDGDLLITLGAGDITLLAEDLASGGPL